MKPRLRRMIGRLLITIFVLNCFSGFSPALLTARAQRKKVIVVNAEQPNLWTLEQAHYLLAQMHRRNLDLKAKSLEELDPNEIAGLRFDVMRMMVEFGATFNQADLVSNRLLSQNQSFNAERRQQLLTERDGLRRESVRLAGEVEELETEKASTEDEDAKKILDARIAAKKMRLARVDKEIETLNGELGTLNAPSGTLTATTGGATFDASKLPKSDFDEAFKAAAKKQIEKFNESPQLNASLRLDNFLQMQYEIISKQLALLRDELGPGERLVFLELPQTVNAAHHESKRKWAQSWWKIAGYTHRERTDDEPTEVPSRPPAVDPNHRPITVAQDFRSITNGSGIDVPIVHTCSPGATTAYTNSNVILVKDTPPPTPTPTPARRRPPPPPPAPPPTKAAPYPSSIEFPYSGRVTKVTVTLRNFNHSYPDDVDMLLVGPQGQNAIIWSDVGGSTPAHDVTITLDDEAANSLPDAGPLPAGAHSYKPKNFNGGDAFPADAPEPLGGEELRVFNGTNPKGTWKLYVVDDDGENAGSVNGGWSLDITTDCTPPAPTPTPMQVTYRNTFVNLNDDLGDDSELSGVLTNARFENRMVRTVELIPRQGSLNVNDMKLNVKAGALNFVLSTLFGFGSRLSVQRQREQFSQFVQQELYSSAFGKGSREFGWTFTPMPGTDRLHSGVRTTYAVVVVPEAATSLVLEANGCYFPRSHYPPNNFEDTKDPRWHDTNRTSRNCEGGDSRENPTKVFVVPIPSARAEGGNEFWVDKVSFQPVGKGKQAVVAISGENFSPQMGVLINGVPLLQSIGLAQPLILDDSASGRRAADDLKGSEIGGRIERIDANKLIFSLRMPPDFTGTPTITLIAPGRATDINDLPLDIRGTPNVKLSEYTPTMFGFSRSDPFRITGVKLFRVQGGRLIAQVSGAGFGKSDPDPNSTSGSDALSHVLVNGSDVRAEVKSPSLMVVTFDAPTDETIRVTLVSRKGETAESDAVANPAFRLSVAEVEVVTYEAGDGEGPGTILVKIKGTGFRDSLTATLADKVFPVAVKSATEAVFTMPDPKGAAIVTLQDDSGQRARVVVARKSPPPK